MVYTLNFNKNGKWLYMELTEKEEEEVQEEHMKFSMKVMADCIKDARVLCDDEEIDENKMAVALFNSRCPSVYGFMQNRLMDKVKKVSPESFFDMNIYLMVKEKMKE